MKKNYLLHLFSLLTIVSFTACNSSELSQQERQELDLNENKMVQLTSYEDSLLNLLAYSEEFIKKLEVNKNNFGNNPRIPKAHAINRVKLYKLYQRLDRQNCQQQYDPKKDTYAHTFKLEHMTSFLEQIKNHNDDPNTPNDSIIHGVRIYRSLRLNAGQLEKEVFILPVLKGGGNFYAIDDDVNVKTSQFEKILKDLSVEIVVDDMILDSSVPCPNKCDDI